MTIMSLLFNSNVVELLISLDQNAFLNYNMKNGDWKHFSLLIQSNYS